MPSVVPASGFGRGVQRTARAGVSVTAGATVNTMGAWTTLLDPISFDCCALVLGVRGVSASAANSSTLLDVGVGPSGGGNEQVVIPFFDAGAASASASAIGKVYVFPLYIPAGKALRARAQSVVASKVATVNVEILGLPPHGFAEDAPQQWYQYGAVSASSQGTGLSSGNGAFGTAVDVTGGAGTVAPHRWFFVGLDLSTDTNVANGIFRVRLSLDSGGNNVIGMWDFQVSNTEDLSGPRPGFPACVPVPQGSPLFVAVEGSAVESLGAIVYAA